MTAANLKAIFGALIAMMAGYALWLAGIVVVVATLPVSLWAVGGALLLTLIIVGAVGAAHFRQAAATLLWVPVLPVLVSIYLLICIVH